MSPSDITGLVLAGGKSTRFGTDKAQYAVDGRAMIAHVVDAVAAVVETVMISVGDYGESWPELPGNVRLVSDHYKEAGPLAGLHAGLKTTATPWLLAVACDMPFVTARVFQQVLAGHTIQADAVVARTPDGRTHPLCACYHVRTLPTVEMQLEAGEWSLHTFLDQLDTVCYVDLPAGPLRNVNRLTDLDFR